MTRNKIDIKKLEEELKKVKLRDYLKNGCENMYYEIGIINIYKKYAKKYMEFTFYDSLITAFKNSKSGDGISIILKTQNTYGEIYTHESVIFQKDECNLKSIDECIDEFRDIFKIERNFKNEKIKILINFLNENKNDEEDIKIILKELYYGHKNDDQIFYYDIDRKIIDSTEMWNEWIDWTEVK